MGRTHARGATRAAAACQRRRHHAASNDRNGRALTLPTKCQAGPGSGSADPISVSRYVGCWQSLLQVPSPARQRQRAASSEQRRRGRRPQAVGWGASARCGRRIPTPQYTPRLHASGRRRTQARFTRDPRANERQGRRSDQAPHRDHLVEASRGARPTACLLPKVRCWGSLRSHCLVCTICMAGCVEGVQNVS